MKKVKMVFRSGQREGWWWHEESRAGICRKVVMELFDVPDDAKEATLVVTRGVAPGAFRFRFDARRTKFGDHLNTLEIFHDHKWNPYPVTPNLYKLLTKASLQLTGAGSEMYFWIE